MVKPLSSRNKPSWSTSCSMGSVPSRGGTGTRNGPSRITRRRIPNTQPAINEKRCFFTSRSARLDHKSQQEGYSNQCKCNPSCIRHHACRREFYCNTCQCPQKD